MKKLVLFFLVFCSVASYAAADYTYKFRVNGLKDTVAYLAHYYGPKMYYKDTLQVDSKGYFTAEGEGELPGGIYAVVMPNKTDFFEFIVTEPSFYMETDTVDLLNNMRIKGSAENDVFYAYRKYVHKMNKTAGPLRNQIKDSLTDEATKKKLREQLIKIDKDVKKYKRTIIKDHADKFIAKVFLTSADPEVPDPPDENDSLFAFHYFKNHYMDGVDFGDERLLRTPVFHNKIKYFLEKLTLQHPDSINASADYLVGKARADREMFKYVVHYITSTYEQSKIMGMDAVFVHMAQNYYTNDQAFWMDSTKLKKLQDRGNKLAPLLIGEIAPNIILQDTLGVWQMLHQIKARFTVLYIWDPDCGHCKKETPKLVKVYEEMKGKGVAFYAPSTDFENKLWKKYLNEHPTPFINVSDSPEFPSNFRTVYDVFSTPIVYLLDKDKRILAKRLSVDQLKEFLDRELDKEAN